MPITIFPTRTASSANRDRADTTPINFDPADYPILARHWFGIEPLRPISQIATDVLFDIGTEGGEETAQAATLFGRP